MSERRGTEGRAKVKESALASGPKARPEGRVKRARAAADEMRSREVPHGSEAARPRAIEHGRQRGVSIERGGSEAVE